MLRQRWFFCGSCTTSSNAALEECESILDYGHRTNSFPSVRHGYELHPSATFHAGFEVLDTTWFELLHIAEPPSSALLLSH
jgi:hypothetical protein